jgi:nitric oxide dioxygenase
MLSTKTIQIVKSTAPILQEHGETLTRHFYKRMFTHNPEVAPFFNPAHQQAGKQQRALAGAIAAYAANIDNLEVLGGAVELIAQKHASLMIKPEHYPIVGANLLASIREVLGEGATEDVISAWAEAYGFLADILIGREKQIYEENANKPGGWEGFKSFRVTRKEKESSNITSFYLAAGDGTPLPSFKPGQYITLRAATPKGSTTMRNYSLSDKPGREWLRISVKRELPPEANTPAGYISNMLHDTVEVGHTIEIAPPCGEFFLDVSEKHTRPLVLLAAGVGITPIHSILLTALDAFAERRIILVHAILNEDVQPFRSTFDALADIHHNLKVYYRYSEAPRSNWTRTDNASTGLVSAEYLEGLLPGRDADYYFCGPQPFMVSLYHGLMQWGIPASQAHFEFFGPQQSLKS